MKQARDNNIDFEKIEDFCKIASHNLKGFGYAEKKLALETMKVKVRVDDNSSIKLEGVLPVPDEVCTVYQHS